MRAVFFVYWIWYSIMVYIMEYTVLPMWGSKLAVSIMFYNLGFVLIAPVLILVYPSFIKSHRSDPTFLSLCLMAGIIRIIVWSFVVWGVRNNVVVLGINIFAMGIVALGEKHFKKIDNQYFKY